MQGNVAVDRFACSIASSGRKKNAEAGSGFAGGGAFHFDLASQLVDDAFNDPQADAGALIAFGGEKRLEDGLQIFLRNAAARVANSHHNLIVAGLLDRQIQLTLLSDGIDGVGDEVGENLAQFAGVDRDFAFNLIVALDFDLGRLQPRTIDGANVIEQLGKLGDDRETWSRDEEPASGG